MHPVSTLLLPRSGRTALRDGHTPSPQTLFLCVQCQRQRRGRRWSAVWDAARTDQIPSPRLRTARGSYKHHICIALNKQSHVM